jgi:hypothetical protein
MLGSNSTIALPAKALRSLASTSGVIERALELSISRLGARLKLVCAACLLYPYVIPRLLNSSVRGESPIPTEYEVVTAEMYDGSV